MKKNRVVRQHGALERLKGYKFFEKGDRNPDTWEKKREKEIEILEKRLNV